MKKTALLALAVLLGTVAGAQVTVGLQGGYHFQEKTYSWNTDHQKSTTWLGGGQLGVNLSSRFYIGVMGGYLSTMVDTVTEQGVAPYYSGRTNVPIEDVTHHVERAGWTVRPLLRYEMFKYGNMHFNMMLQGSITSLGYSTHTHSFKTPTINNGEYFEEDPTADSISSFTWSISLRPTLIYEFSKHLSAELSLDFLSIGYVSSQEKHDAEVPAVANAERGTVYNERRIYAGLNTLMETLQWESPMLRLGFNYTF